MRFVYPLMKFLFQAEDGIRDGHVTGVQTCALPISTTSTVPYATCRAKADTPRKVSRFCRRKIENAPRSARVIPPVPPIRRSEERRVGKEGRARRGLDQRQTNRL